MKKEAAGDTGTMKLKIGNNRQLYLDGTKIRGVIDAGINTDDFKQLVNGEAILNIKMVVDIENLKNNIWMAVDTENFKVKDALYLVGDTPGGHLTKIAARAEPEAVELDDKREILNRLLPAIQATRAGNGAARLRLDEEEKTVVIEYNSGFTKTVNIEADSGIAMIIDVCRALM